MAAPVISILLDSSEESVGSHAPRVILFGAIPTIIPVILEVPIIPTNPLVAPEVGAVFAISPTGVLDLSEPTEQRPERHESLAVHNDEVSRWRDRVASRPSSPSGLSSHDTLAPSSEFPFALVVALPGIRRRPAILIQPVRPILARRLTWRRISHHLSDRHSSQDSTSGLSSFDSSSDSSSDTSFGSSSDSLSDSSSVHSLGCDSPGQTHSGPSTRVASPDSCSPSAGPSRKRCRSPTTLVPSSTPISRSIAPTPADLLPPRKRFRDSHSPKGSGEEHMEVDTADTDLGTSVGVGAHTEDGIGMGVEVVASDIREDEEEIEAEASSGGTVEIEVDPRVGPIVVEDVPEHVTADGAVEITYDPLGDLIQRFHDHTKEIPVSRITDIETSQRQLEVGQLIAGGERAGLTDRVRSLVRENRKVRALLCIERDRVDSLHHHMALSQEEFHQVRRDRDDTYRRLRRLESFVEMRLGFRP
ncbi:hypothetical protein Tco_1505725 [Tanacetum coccineum]